MSDVYERDLKKRLPVVSVEEILTRLKNPPRPEKMKVIEVVSDVLRGDKDFQTEAAKHYNGSTGSPDTPRQARTLLAHAIRQHKMAEGRLNEIGISRILQSLDRYMATRTGLIVFRGQLRAPATFPPE